MILAGFILKLKESLTFSYLIIINNKPYKVK